MRCAINDNYYIWSIYQIADGLFVGRFIGEGALAATNFRWSAV